MTKCGEIPHKKWLEVVSQMQRTTVARKSFPPLVGTVSCQCGLPVGLGVVLIHTAVSGIQPWMSHELYFFPSGVSSLTSVLSAVS